MTAREKQRIAEQARQARLHLHKSRASSVIGSLKRDYLSYPYWLLYYCYLMFGDPLWALVADDLARYLIDGK